MSADRIRVAFVGKGGAGKSTIAGTFARILASENEPVLALDSDPVPGMPYALGLAVEDHPIPDDVVVAGPSEGPRWVLRDGLDARDVVDAYAATTVEGARYLQFGNVWGSSLALQRAQHAWSQVVSDLDPGAFHLVGDLPGGTRQAMFGWAKYADIVCVVIEPTVKSLHSARRLLSLSDATWGPRELILVANKVKDDKDVEMIQHRLKREIAGVVPRDVAVADGERQGTSPLDAAPDGELVAGVRELVRTVFELYPANTGACG